MMPRTLLPLTLFLVVVLLSCNPERLQHSDKLKQQMADMKIKRVTNADLTEAVDSWGEQMVTIAQQEAAAKLTAATENPGTGPSLRDDNQFVEWCGRAESEIGPEGAGGTGCLPV